MNRASAWSLTALGVLLWVPFGVSGCQSGEEPQRGVQAEPPVRHATTAPKTSPFRVDPPRPEPRVEVPTLETASEEAERNLADELKQAFGMPLDCVQDFAAPRPTTIRASVTATVRPTGRIITPKVYGSGLSQAARTCLEQRVLMVALKPLDQSVSETVAAVIEIDYEPPVVVESTPATPEPVLRNVREPLPKRPEVAPSGRPIQPPTSRWISGGFDGGRPIQEPRSKKIAGPRPRPIDGYEVDENAQDWTR